MAEQHSAQEKTEEASQQKLKKSREDGQVSRSKDLSTTLSLLATLVALKFCDEHFYEGLKQGFALSFIDFRNSEIGLDDLPLVLGHHLVLFITTLLPLLVTPLLVVLFSMIPGGWIFSSKNFMPKLSKLNPITGLGRIFSLQNWTELAKSLLKIAVLIVVAVYQLHGALPGLLALQRSNVHSAIGAAFSTFYDITLSLLVVFILFSVIDIPIQYFFFKKKLRMTKQERKEEHKNQEGRPEVKARIRQLQRRIGGHRLGERGDLEDGLRGHGLAGGGVPRAERDEFVDLAAAQHRERGTGNGRSVHQGAHAGFEVSDIAHVQWPLPATCRPSASAAARP